MHELDKDRMSEREREKRELRSESEKKMRKGKFNKKSIIKGGAEMVDRKET